MNDKPNLVMGVAQFYPHASLQDYRALPSRLTKFSQRKMLVKQRVAKTSKKKK